MTSHLWWPVRWASVLVDVLVRHAADSSGYLGHVTGSRKAKGGKMIVKKAVPGEWGIGSTADAMLQITKLPLLVVQPDAVRSLGRANLRTQHIPDDQVRNHNLFCTQNLYYRGINGALCFTFHSIRAPDGRRSECARSLWRRSS